MEYITFDSMANVHYLVPLVDYQSVVVAGIVVLYYKCCAASHAHAAATAAPRRAGSVARGLHNGLRRRNAHVTQRNTAHYACRAHVDGT